MACRGYRTRTRLNLRVMLNEWKLEKMAQEDVNRAKALMATSQEVCPSEVLAVLHEVGTQLGRKGGVSS